MGRALANFAEEGRGSSVVRPKKWGDDSQVGFRGSNASGGRIVLLPGAFRRTVLPKWPLWAHIFFTVFQSFVLPPSACRTSRSSARRIVSCRGVCASSLCPKSHMCPLPHVRVSLSFLSVVFLFYHGKNLKLTKDFCFLSLPNPLKPRKTPAKGHK